MLNLPISRQLGQRLHDKMLRQDALASENGGKDKGKILHWTAGERVEGKPQEDSEARCLDAIGQLHAEKTEHRKKCAFKKRRRSGRKTGNASGRIEAYECMESHPPPFCMVERAS